MAPPTSEPPAPAPLAPDWRRIRGTVFPILLLFALLFVLGRMHIDLANGFTAPRVISDGREAVVFYDEGAHDAAFYFRRTTDAQDFDRKRRVSGVLAGACVTPERLVTLNGDASDPASTWFYSVFNRGDSWERRWSGTFDDKELRLDHPCHVATLADQAYVFGTDAGGDLRVARLSPDDNLSPVDAHLAGAGVPPEPEEGALERLRQPRLVLRQVASTETGDGDLLLMWRVPQRPGGDANGPGEVRWSRFDGQGFTPLQRLDQDLRALTLVTAPSEAGRRLLALGVIRGDEDDTIRELAYDSTLGTWSEAGVIAYEHEGLTRSAGIAALAAGVVADRVLLLAQVGGVIRHTSWVDGSWTAWRDLAKTPVEQRAVVYGWFLSLLLLSGLLIVQGYRGCRARRVRRTRRTPTSLEAYCAPALADAADPSPPAPPVAPEATSAAEPSPPAPLVERLIAFGIDGALLTVICTLIVASLPDVLLRAQDDPRVRLALAAWFLIALVVYFSAFEALFARTPGKLMLGLEVQRLDGGKPGLASCLYRNLFRIELVLPPPYLVAPLSVLVMLLNDQRQRPGDLLASTCVRRSPGPQPA